MSANSQFFLWHTWFHDVFSRPSNGGGFDIAIGNPPYISAPTQIASPELNEQRQRIVASKKYKSLNEKWDLYVPFMELGMQLLCPNGVFSMIVPYPLTNQKYGKKLRKMIVEEYRLLEIADLNGTKIFENATVSNCIPFIQNSQPEGELRITQIFEDKTIREVLSKSPKALKLDKKNYVWNLTEEERTGNRFANMNVLGDFCYISVGMVVNANEKDAQGAFKKEDLISDTYDAIHCRKYIEAKDIDKFQVKRVRYLEWNTERCPEKLRRPTFRELYDRPKLIMNCLGTINVTIDAEEHFLHNHSIYCAILWKDLKDVSNKSISSSVKKFSKHNREAMESLSEKVDLYYLLGILNSSMADQLLTDQRGGDYHIYPEHIRNLPIPVPQREIQNAIGEIAKQILLIRETNTDYSELEEQLNNLVEALYQ
ncbi:DNA modification methylase [Bacteroides thetaiotaomicron]|nr:DNA modification methylase [Bacteroides thetaiotaomicron]